MKLCLMMNDLNIHPDFSISGWSSYVKSGVWHNPYPNNSDEYWMAECLLEAMKSFPSASPNPSVGAIYVKNGIEISRGHTQSYGDLHAEIHALRQTDRTTLNGAKLYVSLEPCAHSGKQPPCADALLQLGLEEVIIAIRDPNPLVGGKGIKNLEKAGIKVKCGVLKSEAFLINLAFFHGLTNQGPAFFLKWAQSVDGALADDNRESMWITGEHSRSFTHFLRSRYDAILVGAQTVIHDQPSLTTRNPLFQGKPNAIRIIYDPKGRLADCLSESLKSELIKKTFSKDAKTILITKDGESEFHHKISENGGLVIKIKDCQFIEEIDDILTSEIVVNYCGKKLGSILVEGGPQLLSNFVAKNKFVGIHCFIAPFFLGGPNKIFGYHVNQLHSAPRLHSVNNFKLGNDILLEMISNHVNLP